MAGPPARRVVIAPHVRLAIESTAGGKLPLGLGREFLAGPRGVGLGVEVRHVGDGVPFTSPDVAVGALGMAPIGAGSERPPLGVVVK